MRNSEQDIFVNKREGEQREYEALKEKHEFALDAYKLEKFAESQEVPLQKDELEQKGAELFSTLNKNLRETLMRAMVNNNNNLKGAIEDEQNLRQIIEARKYEWSKHNIDGNNIGEYLFFRSTGKKPVGKARFERKGPYFLLFLSAQDFAVMDKLDGISEVLGKYHKLGGSVHNLIIINDSAHPEIRNKKFLHESTVRHEVQHYINHRVLGDFNAFDNIGQDTCLNHTENSIKNEFLASLKGRGPIDELKTVLAGSSLNEDVESLVYADNYKNATKEVSDRIRKAVFEGSEAIKSLMSKFNVAGIRDMLVCHLAGLPLAYFAPRIKKLEKFYGQRVNDFMKIEGLARHLAIQKAFFTNEEPKENIGSSRKK